MTTTVNYSWALPTVGASVNTWGTLVNNILTDIDAKMVSKTDAQTLTNKTLTTPVINGFTGTGAAAITGLLTVGNKVASVTHNSTGLTEFQIGNTTGSITGDGAGVGFYFGGTRLAGIRSAIKGGVYKTTIGAWNGSAESEVLDIDTSGNVLVTVPGGLGYGTGAGGTVTQATSKSTDVTLNKPSALITLNNASLAANSAVTFVFSSTSITATDALVINLVSGYAGTAADYSFSAVCAAGFAVVVVRNMTVGALAEAIVIKAIVVKGANA